jgi:pimeloyl-ACP methyl ester carboxylesterase
MKSKLMMVLMLLLSAYSVKAQVPNINGIKYRTLKVQGLDIFYREAGSPDKPTILLLQGFPTSSKMFEKLMIALGRKYHLVAPDYPGYGYSSTPSIDDFSYTFDHLADVMNEFVIAKDLKRYSIYLFDYGAPVGFRLATMHPEKVQTLIIQNGNAYEEGLTSFWDPLRKFWANPKSEENIKIIRHDMLTIESMKWQYTNGMRDTSAINPDTWKYDKNLIDRPGNDLIQLSLLYSYGSNPPLYPKWQSYFRKYQPPALIIWGKNDLVFPPTGAYPYKKDSKNLEFHLLNTGHFAIEEDGTIMANYIDKFMIKNHIN